MELMPIGDLHELILKETKFAESRARSIFQQLILAIDYLHSRKVSHRDLKLENILIDEHDRIKVADFGLSSFMPDGFFLFTSCGSEHYASPEVLSSTAYCGSEVDVWSCGVILFSMIAGYLPFEDNNIVGLTRKIKNANFRPPSSFSGTLKDLVYRMLDPDPIARITTNQIKSHPWFTEKMQKCLKIKKSLKINKKVFEECLNYPEFANLDLPRNIFVDRIL